MKAHHLGPDLRQNRQSLRIKALAGRLGLFRNLRDTQLLIERHQTEPDFTIYFRIGLWFRVRKKIEVEGAVG